MEEEEPIPKRIKSSNHDDDINDNDVVLQDNPRNTPECCTKDVMTIAGPILDTATSMVISELLKQPSPTSTIISSSLSSTNVFDTCGCDSEDRVLLRLSDIPTDVFQSFILPFIGIRQYRFVTSINRILHEEYMSYITAAYKSVPWMIDDDNDTDYDDKFQLVRPIIQTTYLNGSTLEHTKICYTEMKCSKHNDCYEEKYEIAICKSAALSGNIESIRYLHSHDCYWDDHSVCAAAAQSGSLPTLQYLQDHGCPWNRNNIYNDAVQSGNMNMLLFLHEQKCERSYSAYDTAVKYKHDHIIRYLEDQQLRIRITQPGNTDLYRRRGNSTRDKLLELDTASKSGHIHILRQYRSTLTWRVFKVAAIHGQLRVLQWWYDTFGTTNLPDTFTARESHSIAMNGHYHVIQWILQNTPIQFQFNVKSSNKLCSEVALYGNIQLLQFVREQGCMSWTVDTCANAALNGHLELLQYVRKHGCPWNWKTCANAALNGHLHVLRWARQQDCPWDYKTCKSAAQNGHVHVLRWARNNGLKLWMEDKVDRPLIKHCHNPLHLACQSGNFGMVRYLIEECGAYQDELFGEYGIWAPLHFACCEGHVNIVKYLINEIPQHDRVRYATSFDESPLDVACKYGHLQISKFLIEFGVSKHDLKEAMYYARNNGYYKLAQYLVEDCQIHPSEFDIKAASDLGYTFLAKYLSSASKKRMVTPS